MSRKTVRQVTVAAIVLGGLITAWGVRQWWWQQPTPLRSVALPTETNQDQLEQAINSVQQPEPSPQPPTPREIILSEMSESAQSGVATFSETERDRVKVTIQITEPRVREPQPAFIYRGSCTGLQEVLFPLNSVIRGSSVTSLDNSMEEVFVPGQPAVVVVGQSAAEPNRIVACGVLSV